MTVPDPPTPDPNDPPTPDPKDPPEGDPPGEDPPGGDAGTKRALRAERAKAKKLEDELAQLKHEHASEAERAIAAAKNEGRSEALAEVNARVLNAEVRAAAGGRLADPADATRLLDPADLVGDDGQVDPKAVGAAIDALLEAKPYLGAAQANGGAPPPPRAPQGTRGGPGAPTTDADGDAFLRSVARPT